MLSCRIVIILVDLGVPVQSCRFTAAGTLVSSLNPVKVPALVHRRKLVDIVWCFGAERTATSHARVIFSLYLGPNFKVFSTESLWAPVF
jgi:hypothetical protein